MARSGRVFSAVVSTAFALACAYHSPSSPTSDTPVPAPNMTPTSIRVTASSRTDQKIDVNATVLSADGHYVPNVELTFSVDAGTISPTTVATDTNGAARVTATTPSATTLHISGAGLATQAALPASQAPAVADPIILNVPGTGTTGTAVTMFVSTTGSGPWSWSFGDGQSLDLTSMSTTHTYGKAGTYNVSVSSGPAAASGAITITDPAPGPTTPTPAPPTPPAPAPPAALAGTIACTAAAPLADSTCNIATLTYGGAGLTVSPPTLQNVQWDFGDGSAVAPTGGAFATHKYAVVGSYTVMATISALTPSDGLKTSTITTPIQVK